MTPLMADAGSEDSCAYPLSSKLLLCIVMYVAGVLE